MTKEKLALKITGHLKRKYPDAGCTPDYNHAWRPPVSIRLVTQCTDTRVNVVAKDFYAKYPDVDALVEASVEDIERVVEPCGLGHSKARDISACMKIPKEQYGGKVSDDFDTLLKLPRVGRKGANLIIGDVFRRPVIVTNAHCIRLVNRVDLVDGTKGPKKVEAVL